MCMCMCVYACAQAWARARTYTYVWKPEVNMRCLSTLLLFKMRSFVEPGVHDWGWTGWPMSSKSHPISTPDTPSPRDGVIDATVPSSYVGAGYLNLHHHVCLAGTN